VDLRQLGLAGVRVSEIGLGGNTFGARVDERGTAEIVSAAIELGINFVDTAESYSKGASEEFLGKAVGGHRHEFVIATKTGSPNLPLGRLSRRALTLRIEASLKRLQTDYIDVYYLHFPDPGTSLDETFRALDDAVRAGKILYPAISNHPAWQVAEAVGICARHGYAPPVVTQNRYNLLDRAAAKELIPAASHFGLSFVPHTPLAAGFLTGKYKAGEAPPPGVRGHNDRYFERSWLTEQNFERLQRLKAFASEHDHAVGELAIAWLLADPVVCSVIAGVTSPDQLRENARAGEWKLTSAERDELAPI
jgi:aryl-alcohol dehydrogenase-like predicted oxidoreductase